MKNRLHPIFQFKSIQSSIIFGFLGVISVTLFISIMLSYSFSSAAIESNSRDYTFKLIEQVNSNIEYYIKDMDNISKSLSFNYDVNDFFSERVVLTTNQREEYANKIGLQFTRIMESRTDISYISIFGEDSSRYLSSTTKKLNEYADIKSQEWYTNTVNKEGETSISASRVQNIYEGEYPWVVSLSKLLKSIDGTEEVGVLLIDLNYSVIDEICNKIKIGERGYIYIIDNNGDIVYHPNQQLIYSNVKKELISEVLSMGDDSIIVGEGDDAKMYTVKSSDYTGWKIVGVAYLDELFPNKEEVQLSYVLAGLGCFFMAIVISAWISRRISKPIKVLSSSMKEVQNHNLDTEIHVDTNNEIGELSDTFNVMTGEIKTLIEKNNAEQKLKRKSELKALQAQINPHFLYNTLDSIIWMSVANKNEEVIEMTSALAKLFRISISKGAELITIGDEVEHVNSYLTIQKIRYGETVNFEISVDEDLKKYKVLKLVLQPMVENAIYHGLKSKLGKGNILISVTEEDDIILLKVKDNGIGIKPEDLANIYEVDSKKGVGVRNVNERIKLYFGDEYGLFFESEVDLGTTVTIKLPKTK